MMIRAWSRTVRRWCCTLILLGALTSCQRETAQLVSDGALLELKVGEHEIVAEKTELDNDRYIILGAMAGQSSGLFSYFSANLFSMPYEQGIMITKQYPNYRSCGSEGLKQIKRIASPITLIAANKAVDQQIEALAAKADKSSNWVSVKIYGPALHITSHEYQGRTATLSGMGQHILVERIDELF